MGMDIHFKWRGVRYRVDYTAYGSQHIVLPDGTVLQPKGWLESYPPQLAGATEVAHLWKGLPLSEIAANVGNAVIAEVAE